MRKIIHKHIFSLLTIIFITTLSLMPAQEFPQTDVQFADKWVHWVMYGFLTLIIGTECILKDLYLKEKGTSAREKEAYKKSKGTAPWQFLAISVFSSMFGGLMELGQAYLTSSRHGDWLDVYANTFGALCAMCLLLIYHYACYRRN